MQISCDVIFNEEKQEVTTSVENNEKENESNENDSSDKSEQENEEDTIIMQNESTTSFESAEEETNTNTFRDTHQKDKWCDVNSANRLNSRLRVRENNLFASDCEMLLMAMMINNEPEQYDDAVSCDNKKEWIEAMNDEYNSLTKNKTWYLVNLPENKKAIDNRWVYKIKYSLNGEIDRYKARLVVRGVTQEYGVDYNETFSPVVKFSSLRTILAIAAALNLKLKQFDVKTAFLHSDLDEEIYMKQPKGFDDGTNKVCRLMKSLYGLKLKASIAMLEQQIFSNHQKVSFYSKQCRSVCFCAHQ